MLCGGGGGGEGAACSSPRVLPTCRPQGWYDEVFNYPKGGAIFAPGAAMSTQGHRPAALWPGECKPGLWLSHVSRIARAVASVTPTDAMPLPPVFNGCSTVLDPGDELRARDLYCAGRTPPSVGLFLF